MLASAGASPARSWGGLLFNCEAEEASLSFLGVVVTETVAGSKAEPTSLVRGCPPVGAADRSTTSSIAHADSQNAGCAFRAPRRALLAFIVISAEEAKRSQIGLR